MKTYRVYRDISVADNENEFTALKYLNEDIQKQYQKGESILPIFNIDSNPFTEVERLTIFEIARLALKNYDPIPTLTPEQIEELLQNLNKYLHYPS